MAVTTMITPNRNHTFKNLQSVVEFPLFGSKIFNLLMAENQFFNPK